MKKKLLTPKDIEVLMFLGKYKLMRGADCKRIYKTKDYYRKRLKILEKEKYIRRINKLYIKLDSKGTKIVKGLGYDYNNMCRKKEYQERLKQMASVAALTIDSNIEFDASWDLKDNTIFTETARKYLGKIMFQGQTFIVYYIEKGKQTIYIKQIINDIQKSINYRKVIIFIQDLNILKDKNFIFGRDNTIIINPTIKNFDIIRLLNKIDFYEVIEKIYSQNEILLSNWKKADYMTQDKRYILVMPFLDTEKLHKLNTFYRNNQKTNRVIDIITLKENKEKINEILTNKANIVELDNYLGGNE